MIRKFSVNEVKHIAYELAQLFMKWDEPIPEFETRYPGILESCLAAPFQTFNQKDLYKGLTHKAAVLFYLMIKNHPFENGNKRIAVTTLFCFLYFNKKWLRVDHRELYRLAVSVAESRPYSKDQHIALIKRFVEHHLVDQK